MDRIRFDTLTTEERHLLFEALLHCVDTGTGIGFRGYDQGHPDYHDGAEGREPPPNGDVPEKNALFQMLQELSLHNADDSQKTVYMKHGVFNWPQFCQRATESSQPPVTYKPLWHR